MGSTHVFGIYAISSMHSSAAFLPVQSMYAFSLVFTSSTAQAAFKGSSVPNQELLLLLFFMGSYLPCAMVAHINKLMAMLHLENVSIFGNACWTLETVLSQHHHQSIPIFFLYFIAIFHPEKHCFPHLEVCTGP